MIELLSSEDKLVKFPTHDVVRIRATLSGEEPERTRVDADRTYFVQQIPGDVAAKITLALPSLIRLRLPDGEPVWFDALKVEGPVHIAAVRRFRGVHSSVVLGGRLQPSSNSDWEVADTLAAAGGMPTAVPSDGL